MKLIVYTRPDGGVSVIHPAPKARREDETEEQFLERIRRKRVPADATNVLVCEDVPRDRDFREAWECRGASVEVNMDKARTIHMNRIRAARNEALKKLDAEWFMAAEKGDTHAMDKIAAHKQRLRDLPQTFDLSRAATPEALKTLWPADLEAL